MWMTRFYYVYIVLEYCLLAFNNEVYQNETEFKYIEVFINLSDQIVERVELQISKFHIVIVSVCLFELVFLVEK